MVVYIPLNAGFGLKFANGSWEVWFGHLIGMLVSGCLRLDVDFGVTPHHTTPHHTADVLFLVDVVLNFCKTFEVWCHTHQSPHLSGDKR